MDSISTDAAAFVEGEIEPLVIKALDVHLKDQLWDEDAASTLTHHISEDVIESLTELNKPFKYVVNCILTQNTGAGLTCSVSEYCDALNDGVCVVRWPTEKTNDNGNLQAVVTIFGLALGATA